MCEFYQQVFWLHPALHQRNQEEICARHQGCTYRGTPTKTDSHIFNVFHIYLYFTRNFYFGQLTLLSSFYLKCHPDGVDLCSRPCEGRCQGPDGEQGGLSLDQLQNRLSDRALVLIAGHHKVKDDERGEAEETHYGDEGKPVHLPEDKSGSIQKKIKL